MSGRHPDPVRIIGSAPGADLALEAALEHAEAVLVHREGTTFAPGAVERMVSALHRPHRRLVRVHSDAGPCYLARAELLAAAIRHGLPAAMLVADPPGLDRELALAVDAVAMVGPTPVDDPASGRWRCWLDGAVVGVRAATDEDPEWADRVARRHGPRARAGAVLRRHVGRARREAVRLRQRPQR